MEAAKIDWKKIESKFVQDQLYESINAPKWVDLLAPDQNSVDDEAWFCRPDCNHPETADDFLKSTSKKLLSCGNNNSSATRQLDNHIRRDVKVKRRMPTWATVSPSDYFKFSQDSETYDLNLRTAASNQIKTTKEAVKSSAEKKRYFKFNQDSENHDPNYCTPSSDQLKIMKAVVKSSSTEEKNNNDEISQNNAAPSLKSTLSARNLFAGKDILNHITEFCNELKKLATRAQEKEDAAKSNFSATKGRESVERGNGKIGSFQDLDKRKNERKPLIELGKTGRLDTSLAKGDQQKKISDKPEQETVLLSMEDTRPKREENLLLIRRNPPSPQCFSATAGTKSTPSKTSRTRLMERGILQEVVQNKKLAKEDHPPADKSKTVSTVDGRREARTLDVFWFLKPCTLSD